MLAALLTVALALSTNQTGALVVAELDPSCRAWSSAPIAPLPMGPARRALPGTLSVRLLQQGKLSVTSAGAPASDVLVAIADAAKLSVTVRAARGREPVFAALEGTEPKEGMRAVGLSVGLVMLQVSQSELAFVDVNESDLALRSLAASREKVLPTTLRLIPTPRGHIAAQALARFALGCRGRALALENQGVVLVEDVRDNLDLAEALVHAIDERPPRAVVSVPLRAHAGVHGDAPVCGARADVEIDSRTSAALLAFARGQAPAVIGCVPDWVVSGANPSAAALSALGLVPFRDVDGADDKRGPLARPKNVSVWTSDGLARRYHASLTSHTTRLVVFATPHAEALSRAVSFMLGRDAALGDDGAGIVVVSVRDADELERVDRLRASLEPKPAVR